MRTALALALVLAALGTARADEREGLAVRMFKLEHQSAETVARAIRSLGSGGKDTKLEANDGLDSITVRDLPANISAIEQAIRVLDAPRPDLVFHMRVLIAGPHEPTDVPADMKKVVRQLQDSLNFKAYHQVAAITQRVRSGAEHESHGVLQLAPPAVDKPHRADYEIELRPTLTGARRGARSIQLRRLKFRMESREDGRADLRTDIVLPEGETVVVGSAALGDRAVILVVWASAP